MSENRMMQHPRLLIVGTVPFNHQDTSRAFDAYFHGWEKENIAQIFSDPKTPIKGHCGTLYQITDVMLLNRWLGRTQSVGRVYTYDELEEEGNTPLVANTSYSVSKLYRLGQKHTPLTRLMRGLLWRKIFWDTPELEKWLEDFNPECVFLSFSDDFFILKIALYIAEKFDIPICSSTGDDYYFNDRFSLNPFYYIYHSLYKRLNRRVFRHKGSAIYISDKIRDRYNSEFGLDGETVYLVSDIQRRPFRAIDKNNVHISYFGNLRSGRNTSLADIGTALGMIDYRLRVDVYSGEQDEGVLSVLKSNPNISFHGRISYDDVIQLTKESDILCIVEGFKKNEVLTTRYSLSTKVADSLASGCNILVYGSAECGAMEYMNSIGCATVCYSIDELVEGINKLLNDVEYQQKNYNQSIVISNKNHTLEHSNEIVERIVRKLVNENV